MPSRARRVTLRDIAAAAGCHFTTVSLALRNAPGLPRATCAKLQALAKKMGYVPDPMLASLSSYRSALGPIGFRATLAWLTNHPTRNGWRRTKVFEDYFAGAELRAREFGYALEEFWVREPGMTPARATQILAARGITGLIVAPQPEPSMTIELDWSGFSAVAIGYSLAHPSLHLVCANQYRAVRLAMHHVAVRGFTRPGLVMLRASDERVEQNWTAGFHTAQQSLRSANRLPPLLLDAWDERAFAAWLARHQPDMVITKFEEVGAALRRCGVATSVFRSEHTCGHPGRGVAIAYLTLAEPDGERAGIYENPARVGAGAVEYLIGMIHRNERGVPASPQQLLIEASWVDGQPTRGAWPERAVPVTR